MVNTVIVNSAEICLKKGNRHLFEKRFLDNIRAALIGLGPFRIRHFQAAFHLVWDKPLSEAAENAVADRLSRVFGIAWFRFVHCCPANMDDISRLAVKLVTDRPSDSGGQTLKVEARRSDKEFPLKSPEIGRQVGAAVLQANPGLKVDLGPKADIDVKIEVAREGAFVSIGAHRGPDGLPLGVSGRLVSLLSGGIDSPVAAWKMMGRGCRLIYVHCHSYPYVKQESVEKIRRLARIIDRWQGNGRLYLLPFADTQREIVAKARSANRVLLYRRMMLRLAEAVANREGALGLVTGDSVGQVASQTLPNINAVSAAVSLPVYRPLCGDNKDAIVAVGRRIGTYGVSIEPHDDCCSLFTPSHPETQGTAVSLDRDEAAYDAAGLLKRALDEAEIIDLPPLNS